MVAAVAGGVIAIDGHHPLGPAPTRRQEEQVSENPGTAGPDPAALVAMMPFAAGLGLVVDAAGAQEVRGHLAWRPGVR